MPTIMFWNVERLSATTKPERRQGLIDAIHYCDRADLFLFCELMPSCDEPAAQNLTYRAENSHQLCYGAWDRTFTDVVLRMEEPTSTPEYRQAGYKGGTRFRPLVSRAVGYAGQLDGVHLYVVHAPSSSTAVKAVSFIACWLNSIHGAAPWLLVGDFNCIPGDLARSPVGVPIGDYISRPYVATRADEFSESELDYTLSNFANRVNVSARRSISWRDYTDHSPIIVRWD